MRVKLNKLRFLRFTRTKVKTTMRYGVNSCDNSKARCDCHVHNKHVMLMVYMKYPTTNKCHSK